MRFIKRTILKMMRWAAKVEQNTEADKYVDDRRMQGIALGQPKVSTTPELGDMSNGMNFTVYNAVGGKVIQIRSYNMATDRHKSVLYVITDKEDLGQELGQIITMERLSS